MKGNGKGEGERGQGETSATPYDMLGGEVKLRALVDRFYDLMDLEPDYAVIRKLHPTDLAHSRDKLFMFLSGWLGGPALYAERYGNPMLRARHLPFAIGVPERDRWMQCMIRAMQETGVEDRLRATLARAFFGTADWMRNRAE
ncbi:MAG TPA: group II truncated hemoglobin [Burkholderiales bacterium]|nr:group II truncated hemoglobin [Burkholderiales bacterium]